MSNTFLRDGEQQLSDLQKEQVKVNLGLDNLVGEKTDDGGEIFNDYANNQALGNYSSARGYITIAGGKGFTPLVLTPVDETDLTLGYNITIQDATGLEVGDIMSIYSGKVMNNFDFYSTITAIDETNTIITVDVMPDGIYPIDGTTTEYIWFPKKPNLNGDVVLGTGAYAEGYETKAVLVSAHAEGCETIAAGKYSHAEGRLTTAGYAAHAEGYGTTAEGHQSHAEGYETIASESATHAEGFRTLASGLNAHAEGNITQATSNQAHAEGYNSIASGSVSHAEGNGTTAEGMYAHSEGSGTKALTQASHAEGTGTTASGLSAHAEGYNTSATGLGAHSEGHSTQATKNQSHAEGYNTTASGSMGHAEGNSTTASGEASHAEGASTTASSAQAHAEGYGTTASGSVSHAEGYRTTASGARSHAEGHSTQALNNQCHAEGYNTQAKGGQSHAEGNSTVAEGEDSHSEGKSTHAYGAVSHAEGLSSKANGNYSHAEGVSTNASGEGSHSEGNSTIASGVTSHAEGASTQATKNQAHAEGYATQAIAEKAHAEGDRTIAAGIASHAEGTNTIAGHRGFTILGHSVPGVRDPNTNRWSMWCSVTLDSIEGLNINDLITFRYNDSSSFELSIREIDIESNQVNGPKFDNYGPYAEFIDANNISSFSNPVAYVLLKPMIGTKLIGGNNAHASGLSTIAFADNQTVIGQYNATNTDALFIIGNGTGMNYDQRSNAFTVFKTGDVATTGTYQTSGADYAEWFEWEDGNPAAEDRVGLLVALDGDKIRKANSSDSVFGVTSAMPGVLGDTYDQHWYKKYLTDDFGRIQYEEVEVVEVDDLTNETRTYTETRPIISTEFDATREYIPRSKRPEWSAVGLMGKLYVRDDGSCVAGGYIKAGENGIATRSDDVTNIRVLKRTSENIVYVFVK